MAWFGAYRYVLKRLMLICCIQKILQSVKKCKFYKFHKFLSTYNFSALTENIVKVLPKFKCPHSIEPHQIQGLDCIRIFPVIAWLVKETIEAKKRHGDEILRFSSYQFENSGWFVQGEAENKPKAAPRIKQRPKRVYARTHGMQMTSLEEDVRCTLLEYGLYVDF